MTHIIVKSTEKYKNIKTTTGFVKDEDGNFHMVPMKWPKFSDPAPASTVQSSGDVRRSKRKYIPIQPMKLPAFCFESPKQPAKKPRVEQIRKELFKVPPKRQSTYGNRFSGSMRQSKLHSGQKPKVTTKKSVSNRDSLPLIDTDVAEKLLAQNKLNLPSVNIVLFPDSPEESTVKKPALRTIDEELGKNESMTEELEFLRLEKALASATKTARSSFSPIQKNKILNKIKRLVKQDQETLNALKQQFCEYQQAHDNNLRTIMSLIENIEDKENCNSNRRSTRVASQVKKFVSSPSNAPTVDLRKTILNKNITKKNPCGSPRTTKAMDMYASMRSDCSVLHTPIQSKVAMESVRDSAASKLSRKIQKQCLLLQDTPRPS